MGLVDGHPLVRWVMLCLMMVLTKAWFIHWMLPDRIRQFLLVGWTDYMMWVAFINFGKVLYLDQDCELPDPPNFKGLCEVDPKHAFSEDDIKKFYTQGFYGPITVFSQEKMGEMRKDISDCLLSESRRSKVYIHGDGTEISDVTIMARDQVTEVVNGRDRHIDCYEIWNLVNQDPIKERLAQMLGPELVLWRSQFFNKTPGTAAIAWHAASTYLSETLCEPVLKPKNINTLFQITTWVAIDDADLDNGCLHFIPGSHRRFLAARFREGVTKDSVNGKFAGFAFQPDHPITNEFPDFPVEKHLLESGKVVSMPLKAGQCVMFFERCIHGSPQNTTKDRRRMGITFRVVRPDCRIYGSRKWHGVLYLNTRFDLNKWGCLILRGNPKIENRVLPAPQKPAGKNY